MVILPPLRRFSLHVHKPILLVVLITLLVTGCSAIQSSSVESLVVEQGKKIEIASAYSEEFINQDQKRRKAYDSAITDLNDAMISLQIAETQMALTMAAKGEIKKLSGRDAGAFAYMAGRLYWSDHAGLGAIVQRQFQDDFEGLEFLARELQKSWASLDTLSNQIELYSQTSKLSRGVNPAFVAALLNQTHVESSAVDDLLRKSVAVNKALRQVSGFDFVDSADATALSSFSSNLITLLELVKTQKEVIDE